MKTMAILSAVVCLGAIAGGVYSLDSTYARSQKVNQIEQRLDRKILSDNAMMLQRRIWQLFDRYGEDKARAMPEYRELESQRQGILRELQR